MSRERMDVLAVFDLLRQLAQQSPLYGPSVDDAADKARVAAAGLIEALDKINERAASWHTGFGTKENRRWVYEVSGAALAALTAGSGE